MKSVGFQPSGRLQESSTSSSPGVAVRSVTWWRAAQASGISSLQHAVRHAAMNDISKRVIIFFMLVLT